MIFSKSNKKSVAWLVFAVFALTLIFTATLGFWNFDSGNTADAAIYNSRNTGVKNDIDYIADRFDLTPQAQTGGHVFDLLSSPRMIHTLKQDGKSIFVLASSRNATSIASLPLINEAARAAGIQKIYYFDVHLAAEYGSDFTNGNDMTMSVEGIDGFTFRGDGAPASGSANWTDLWVPLTTYTSNSAFLKYISSDYKSDDTYVFVFDRKAGGTAVADSPATIVSSLLIKNASDCDNATAFKASVTKVFTDAGISSTSPETRYDNYFFFTGGAWAQTGGTVSVALNTTNFPNKAEFRLKSVSLYEFMYIMDQPGERLLSSNGTWCGDSQGVIGLYAYYSIKYNTDTIYIMDMCLGNDAAGSRAYSSALGSLSRSDYRTGSYGGYSPNGTAYLGQMLMDKFGQYEQSPDNSPLIYHPDGDPSKPLVYGTQQALRSPTLWRYDRDHKVQDSTGLARPRPVIDIMMHRSEEWETQGPSNTLGTGHNPIGTLADLEFNSNAMSVHQMGLARAKLAVFFGATQITYGARDRSLLYTSSREVPTEWDAAGGCGSLADPVVNTANNEGGKLIPNQGTEAYSVNNYDITVRYYPDRIPAADIPGTVLAGYSDYLYFSATTVISAKANVAIDASGVSGLKFDFKPQNIFSVKVTVGSDTTNIATGFSKATLPGYDTGSQATIANYNKLSINLSSAIAANAEFTVTVVYATGFSNDFYADGIPVEGFAKTMDYVNGENVYGASTKAKGAAALGETQGPLYWYPSNNSPHDGATYDITLIAPSEFTSVSNGYRISNTNDAGTNLRTTKWKLNTPTSTYQTFAYFSNNVVELSTPNTVPAGGNTVNQLLRVGADENGNARWLQNLAFVNRSILLKSGGRALEKIFNYYGMMGYYIQELEKIAGPYPGKSIPLTGATGLGITAASGITNVHGATGFVFENMSDGSDGYSASWGAIETKDRFFYTFSDYDADNIQGIFIHEMTHNWFGNSVRHASWRDLWLTEGWTMYMEDLYWEKTAGISAQKVWSDLFEQWKPATGTSLLWSENFDSIQESDLFDGARWAYHRGGMVIGALRAYVGDRKFEYLIKEYQATYAGKAITGAEFIQFAKDVTGVDLTEWEKEWINDKDRPAAWPTANTANAPILPLSVVKDFGLADGTATVSAIIAGKNADWQSICLLGFDTALTATTHYTREAVNKDGTANANGMFTKVTLTTAYLTGNNFGGAAAVNDTTYNLAVTFRTGTVVAQVRINKTATYSHNTVMDFADFNGYGTRSAFVSGSSFSRLELDGKIVATSNYSRSAVSATPGTMVTLSEAYLNTLADGEYEFEAVFADGDSATLTITVAKAAGGNNGGNGGNGGDGLGVWAGVGIGAGSIAVLGGGGFAIWYFLIKRKKVV